MVLCTEFLDGWWSWEPLRRSCVRCGWCRAKNTSIKLPCCINLAFHIISVGRCVVKQPSHLLSLIQHNTTHLYYVTLSKRSWYGTAVTFCRSKKKKKIWWRDRDQQDATNLMFIIKLLSQHVSGIIMPIIRRTRVCTLVFLMMGINMPETCWDKCLIINIRLVASCWSLSLSLHPTFMMHGHKSLKKSDFWIQGIVIKMRCTEANLKYVILQRASHYVSELKTNRYSSVKRNHVL